MDTKECRCCHKRKPASEFSKVKGYCLVCRAANARLMNKKKKEICDPFDPFIKKRTQSKEQLKAHGKLHYALKKGDVVKPDECSDCGRTGGRICGHHEDYDKPLDVIWLCSVCHKKIHADD